MSRRHPTLFHSVLSPYLYIGLLEPLELIEAAQRAYHQGLAPIHSVEGFVRQVLGWREYISWQYWRLMPGLLEDNPFPVLELSPGARGHPAGQSPAGPQRARPALPGRRGANRGAPPGPLLLRRAGVS